MSEKFYEIVVRKSVKLPALSTSVGEMEYPYLSFLSEWVVSSPGMRRDENLAHRFEWEDAIEEFTARMVAKAGVVEPAMPTKADQADEYAREVAGYQTAIRAAAEGEVFYVAAAAFKAGCESAKAMIDAACESGPARTLPQAYEPKVLRFYHALRQSKAVDANDVPRVAASA